MCDYHCYSRFTSTPRVYTVQVHAHAHWAVANKIIKVGGGHVAPRARIQNFVQRKGENLHGSKLSLRKHSEHIFGQCKGIRTVGKAGILTKPTGKARWPHVSQ